MAVTMVDIAEMLGTTHATVSRALSGDAKISAKMKQRVLAAVEQTGYRPSVLARGLRGGRTQTVGILWGLPGPHPSTGVVRTMATTFMREGYVTYVADSCADVQIIEQALDDFSMRCVDGVILEWHMSTVRPSKKVRTVLESFPAAVLVNSMREDVKVDQLACSAAAPFYDVAEHFARTGRKHLAAMIAHPRDAKVHSFVEGAKAHGLEISSEHVIKVDYAGVGVICEAFQASLKQAFPDGRPTFDAIVCSCDEAAAGVMQVLKEWGLRVPDDIAVVGFNDSELSRFCVPPLASIARCDDEVIKRAVEMLLARLRNETIPLQFDEVTKKFVWRESAG